MGWPHDYSRAFWHEFSEEETSFVLDFVTSRGYVQENQGKSIVFALLVSGHLGLQDVSGGRAEVHSANTLSTKLQGPLLLYLSHFDDLPILLPEPIPEQQAFDVHFWLLTGIGRCRKISSTMAGECLSRSALAGAFLQDMLRNLGRLPLLRWGALELTCL